MEVPKSQFHCPGCGAVSPDFEMEPGLFVKFCTGCRHLWLDQRELGTYLGSKSDLPDLSHSLILARPTVMKCPKCPKVRLEQLPYEPLALEATVQVNYCSCCQGIWLKRDDLDEIRHLQVLRKGGKAKEKPSCSPLLAVDNEEDQGLPYPNSAVNALTLPIVFVVALGLVKSSVRPFLWLFISLNFHEFGHAVSNWLASRFALPLFIGETVLSTQRSLGLYVLGWVGSSALFFWGIREKNKTVPLLALGWMTLQTWVTFGISSLQQDHFSVIGGILGQCYLSTLGIIAFYYPLPGKIRWDFWRFPAALISFFAFLDSWQLWKDIARGTARLPVGSMLYGGDDKNGDIDRLLHVYGWDTKSLIHFMNHLGTIGIAIIVAHYVGGLLIPLLSRAINQQTSPTKSE